MKREANHPEEKTVSYRPAATTYTRDEAEAYRVAAGFEHCASCNGRLGVRFGEGASSYDITTGERQAVGYYYISCTSLSAKWDRLRDADRLITFSEHTDTLIGEASDR